MSKHSVYPFIQRFYPEYDGIQSYPASECAVFCKTNEEWGILSNMASTPIIIEGVEFKSAEHIFQMLKLCLLEIFLTTNLILQSIFLNHLMKQNCL